MPTTDTTTVEVSHQGRVSRRVIDDALEKVSAAADRCREPVTRIELRLVLEPDPARERPALVESTVEVEGTPVRAQVAASAMEEAVDLLLDRLRRRLNRHEERIHRMKDRHRTGHSGPGEWRHGDLPTAPAEYRPVPFDEREVRRQKSFAAEAMSAEEAAFDLEQLGHDFYLFVEADSGTESVIRFRADGTLELLRSDGGPPVENDQITLASTAISDLSLAEAKEHLEASGEGHVFFRDGDEARGQVLYRRFDGHYGLVTLD